MANGMPRTPTSSDEKHTSMRPAHKKMIYNQQPPGCWQLREQRENEVLRKAVGRMEHAAQNMLNDIVREMMQLKQSHRYYEDRLPQEENKVRELCALIVDPRRRASGQGRRDRRTNKWSNDAR
jgi:hypothetical protein